MQLEGRYSIELCRTGGFATVAPPVDVCNEVWNWQNCGRLSKTSCSTICQLPGGSCNRVQNATVYRCKCGGKRHLAGGSCKNITFPLSATGRFRSCECGK